MSRATDENGRDALVGHAAKTAAAAAILVAGLWVSRRIGSGVSLRGRTALVTGGSRGLGYLIAERLLMEGCRVAICARDSVDLARAERRLSVYGGEIVAFACDVSDHAAVDAMVAEIERRFSTVEVLVNNAAVIQVGPLETLDVEDFRTAIDIDYLGAVHTTLAVLPGMRRMGRGRIANITSIGGKVAVPHLLPYDAAKFAAVAFSEGLCSELAGTGISVTTVVPGLMRTGSPARVEYRGRPADEYRWFALGGLTWLTAMSAERAAKRIVKAIRRGETEIVMSWQAKLLRIAHDLAPGMTVGVLGMVNRLLPNAGAHERAQGTELRGELPSTMERALDRAARRSNQGIEPAEL